MSKRIRVVGCTVQRKQKFIRVCLFLPHSVKVSGFISCKCLRHICKQWWVQQRRKGTWSGDTIISHSKVSVLPQSNHQKMQLLRYKAHTALACLEKARKTTPSRRIFKISKAFLCCIPCDTVYGLEWALSVSMMSHILNWTHPKRIKIVIANTFALSKRKTIEQESSIHYRLVHSTCYSERTCYSGFWLVKVLHFYSDHGEMACNKKFIGHKDDSNWLAMALHRLPGGFTQ